MLHYNQDGSRSEIVSEDFFLSSEGDTSPRAELVATVRAYFTPVPRAGNRHPRCRVPARFFWLNEKIGLPSYEPIPPFCERLAQWARLEDIESVSLLLVSGYLGNPASAFGHSLLRFNTVGEGDPESLLDLTFNFGAVVPENEPTAIYIMRGLFGGYVAGFSDSYYYTHDLTYTRTEFRDMWDYRLNLSAAQRTLLVLHLWEIVAREYRYFFLTRNCSSRLADLIGMAMGESFNTDDRWWYLPVELFHRLHELDEEREGKLIRSIDFVPSRQRVMRRYFEALTPELRRMTNRVIEDRELSAGDVFAVAEDRRDAADVLDTLLAYYEYRIEGDKPEVSDTLNAARERVVRARLRLPPSNERAPEVRERRSPAQGAAPLMLGVGGLWRSDGSGYGRIEWSPFHYDLMGFNGLERGALVVLDASIGLDSRGNAFIEGVDFIRVRNLDALTTRIAGEFPWSWNVRIGLSRVDRPEERTTRTFANGGIGLARSFSRSWMGYVSLDGWAYSNPGNVATGPNAGLLFQSPNWKWWIHGGTRIDENTNVWREHAEVQLSRKLSQHRSLHLAAGYDGLGTTRYDSLSLTLRQHF